MRSPMAIFGDPRPYPSFVDGCNLTGDRPSKVKNARTLSRNHMHQLGLDSRLWRFSVPQAEQIPQQSGHLSSLDTVEGFPGFPRPKGIEHLFISIKLFQFPIFLSINDGKWRSAPLNLETILRHLEREG